MTIAFHDSFHAEQVADESLYATLIEPLAFDDLNLDYGGGGSPPAGVDDYHRMSFWGTDVDTMGCLSVDLPLFHFFTMSTFSRKQNPGLSGEQSSSPTSSCVI